MPPDFAAAGLLDGLAGDERAARTELLERLHADGFSLDELRVAADAGRLALLPVERLLVSRRRHTLADGARLAGVDDGFVERNHRSIGLPRPEPGEPVYDDDQVENLRVLAAMMAAGVPEADVQLMGRILGQSSHRTAQAVVDVLARALLQPGDTEADLAVRLADFAAAMLPTLDRLTGSVLRLHLLDVVQREAVVRVERDAGVLAGARDITVAFADLAGFTALSDRLDIEALGDVAARFEALVTGVAEGPVRLVKVLGDGAMLVGDDAAALVRALLDLVAGAARDGLPPVHAGVEYGPALHTAGDWLGRSVNLAARLCAVAPAGAVLATARVRDAAPGIRWEEAGDLHLSGFAERVAAVRALD